MTTRESIRSALARLAIHAGAELNSKPPHWGDAIACDGLTYAAHALESAAPLKSARAWFAPRLEHAPRLGGWFWLWAAEALSAIDVYLATRDDRYLGYARAIIAEFAKSAARSPTGVIAPHPPAQEVWIDAAYFTAPAAARLARLADDRAMAAWALDAMLAYQRFLADDASGLYWHVAYPARGTHSECLWARGNSWFSVAATQVLDDLKSFAKDSELGARAGTLAAAMARQLNAVARLQSASGLWHTVIDREDSYLEASACAGFALALGRALRSAAKRLDLERARRAYELALDALCGQVNPGGEFTGVSQQTPPGDFNFYNSIALGTAPYGAGLCLMALTEALDA
ncbi:MAG TPA: glycoside hydrolase family 88 protein [Candidatus Binataceae bacterium]|nr:glycoside hydrolase family 88 protein [Candidatus Binataceae bacterium]